jgi:hypothetical protein
MPKDVRLQTNDLTDPNDYVGAVDRVFKKQSKIDYSDSFKTKPLTSLNRFTTADLKNKMQSDKRKHNRLNVVDLENAENFELFTGLPRFDTDRRDLYNFDKGRPNTRGNFTETPEFNPMWPDMYRVSPTVKPDARVKNPMPSLYNPDPLRNIQEQQEILAKNEIEGNLSVAQLLQEDQA